MKIAANKVYDLWLECVPELFDPESKRVPEMHAITSSLKAVNSWMSMKGI